MKVIPSVKPASPTVAEDYRGLQGAWLLIASLGVFFVSCIILYAVYVAMRVGPTGAEVMPFFIPRSFILTTVVMLAVSVLLHRSVQSISQELIPDFRRYFILSYICAIVFVGLQGIGLTEMMQSMLSPAQSNKNLYGLTFVLIVLHALHVIGGIGGLTFVMFGVAKRQYDHERHFPVRFCALYWHFLDVVWILMLASFIFAAYLANR